MNQRDDLIESILNYIERKVFIQHINNATKKHSRLSSYKLNPIILRYLSNILANDYTPEGVAKALYYPRVLGTSMTTTFGSVLQKMLCELKLVTPSLIPGMDIEFVDKLDGRLKWCQLKSGPNTLNSKDVNPMIEEFEKTIRLAKQNGLRDFNNNDFIVGILYGYRQQLSQHYKKIDEKFPVYIGNEFWDRITGFEKFYDSLINSLERDIKELEAHKKINDGYEKLLAEIKVSKLFDF